MATTLQMAASMAPQDPLANPQRDRRPYGSTGLQPASGPLPTMKRHQNHSCGHCRRSKKACDGFLLNSNSRNPSDAAASGPNTGILPCSYCVKTKKDCTYNELWGRPQPSSAPSSSSTDSPGEDDGRAKRQRTESHGPSLLDPGTLDFGLDDPFNLLEASLSNNGALDWGSSLGLDAAAPPVMDDPLSSLHVDEGSAGPDLAGNVFETPSLPTDQSYHDDLDSLINPPTDLSSTPSTLGAQGALWNFSQPKAAPRSSISSSHSTTYYRSKAIGKYRRTEDDADERNRPGTSLSPFSIDHMAMARSNNSLITDSLLRIYHDVLENNLACWLAEDTCPYRMQPRRREFGTMQRLPRAAAGHVPQEWGSIWSNRMYRRVKQLDRVAQATRLVRLTRTQSKAASKALDLAIMAFATQWSQVRKHQQRPFATGVHGLAANIFGDDDEFGDSFEQSLQISTWEQARRALQDVSDLESFRVIFAELIFGLVQKPWTKDDYLFEHCAGGPGYASGSKATILSQVKELMAQDGPPVYLERATRKIQALKFRFEASEMGLRTGHDYGENDDASQGLGTEDRGTLGLLYWMAVMFDTVSSSMNERPVAVADEDCQHDDAASDAPAEHAPKTSRSLSGSQGWVLDLYAQDDPKRPFPLHWPCPYDITSRAVARSASVKVLLFRYVSYFQNALRRNERGQAVEGLIQSTTAVYRYWNVTHGAFFRDLTKHYRSVPPRIRSWFPCIAIPWHLAALMFADLVDHVDARGLGREDASAARLDAHMTARIRRSSAAELADLARATTPQGGGGGGNSGSGGAPEEQLPDFHFAVNEGTLLTEPWTVLLIRAFAKASVFHLGVAEDLRGGGWSVLGHESEDLQASLARGKSCINALWFLGRKSGMARNLAKVLAQAMRI